MPRNNRIGTSTLSVRLKEMVELGEMVVVGVSALW
jgi:hypothetical protein